jgi:hypothetical protein
VELTMTTPDPLTAVLDQLAASGEQVTDLDTREAAHYASLAGQLSQLAGMVTTISRALAEDTIALARLEALDRQVTELARYLPRPCQDAADSEEGYRPRPAPAWWKLTGGERRTSVAELRDWAERVYRPGYGHLAAALGPCWPEHELCLYALDIASQLWSALYLQPERSTGLLSAQAEYQARILPALAAQLAAETTRCDHQPATSYGARHG